MCRVQRYLTVSFTKCHMPKTTYSFINMPRSTRRSMTRNKRLCIVCAERVTQMTKTYNDIEAVTRLLEEKERDLELAAKIGQSLLVKNTDFEVRNAELEELYNEASDKVQQLQHQLNVKDALLQGYLQDEDSDELSETTTDGALYEHGVGVVHIDNLQKKMRQLEIENEQLLADTEKLKCETSDIEDRELSLQRDCMKHLEQKSIEVQVLHDELATKHDVNIRQQEELTEYISREFSLKSQINKLVIEKVELQKHLKAAQDSQRDLTTELAEQKEKYEECLGLLRESQEDNKALSKQKKPAFIRHHNNLNSPFLPEGSLALELEGSFRKEGDFPVGYTPEERRDHTKRVMDTAACVRSRHQGSSQSSSSSHASLSRSRRESVESIAGSSHKGSMCDNLSIGSDAYHADTDSIYGSTIGRPGIPGSNDLETALKRLTLRKANDINEHVLKEHDKRRKANGPHCDGSETPTPCQSPGSYISNGSHDSLSDISRLTNGTNFRIPEKLQIVKPIEGSYTLNNWKRLATPDVQGFFESRPGIQSKGERPIDMEAEEEVYSLSDYEEDDDCSYQLGKCLEDSATIYTFSTAKVMHPNDNYDPTTLSSSLPTGVRMSAQVSELSAPPTPSKGCATSTFSMSQGLADRLHERGTHGRTVVNRCVVPQRYSNIMTESLWDQKNSPNMAVYSMAGGVPVTSSLMQSSTAQSYGSQQENAYLSLVDKVKDIGLNTILCIANKSGVAPVVCNPGDSGLNGIISIKRNRRGAVLHQGTAPVRSHTHKVAPPYYRGPGHRTLNTFLASSPVTSRESHMDPSGGCSVAPSCDKVIQLERTPPGEDMIPFPPKENTAMVSRFSSNYTTGLDLTASAKLDSSTSCSFLTDTCVTASAANTSFSGLGIQDGVDIQMLKHIASSTPRSYGGLAGTAALATTSC